jgi:hypothetical protein
MLIRAAQIRICVWTLSSMSGRGFRSWPRWQALKQNCFIYQYRAAWYPNAWQGGSRHSIGLSFAVSRSREEGRWGRRNIPQRSWLYVGGSPSHYRSARVTCVARASVSRLSASASSLDLTWLLGLTCEVGVGIRIGVDPAMSCGVMVGSGSKFLAGWRSRSRSYF